MGVLQPWLLALGLGVAVPLLLHLLQRHQGPRVVFPAVRYLRRAERESARRIRLRQWLLMLLRAAAILLVALAAARPFLAGAGAAHEPTAVVIVLDNSLSTSAVAGERRVFDVLRARALQSLDAAGPDDRLWLVRTASPEEAAAGGDAASVAAQVRAARPTAAAGDVPGALARARAILAGGAGGRAAEIHLLSDLQASELRPQQAEGSPPGLLVWTEPEGPPPNRAISRVAVAGGLAPLAGTRAQLAATVSGGDGDSATLRLFLEDRLAAAAATPLPASVPIALPARQPGLLVGRVEMDPDALQADDRRYFVTRVVPPPVVAAPGASAFLAEALAVMAAAGRVRPGAAAAADVIVLSGSQSLPPLGRSTVLVVLAPATDVELPALNRQLEQLGIPSSYGPATTGSGAKLASPDTTDPLLRTVEQASLTRSHPLQALAGAQADSVLLRTASGVPWAVQGSRAAGGRYVVLGSSLDAESSSIPTTAAMIPLLASVLGTSAGAGQERLEFAIGSEVSLPPGAITVLRPDSVEERVEAAYLVPPLAGIYRIRSADSLLSAFAVNSPAAESTLERVGRGDLDRIFEGWRVRTAADPGRWRRSVFRARLGAELWRPALFLLLGLLLAEALVAASGAGRRTAPRTEAMAKD
jgi:hypothetical protein